MKKKRIKYSPQKSILLFRRERKLKKKKSTWFDVCTCWNCALAATPSDQCKWNESRRFGEATNYFTRPNPATTTTMATTTMTDDDDDRRRRWRERRCGDNTTIYRHKLISIYNNFRIRVCDLFTFLVCVTHRACTHTHIAPHRRRAIRYKWNVGFWRISTVHTTFIGSTITHACTSFALAYRGQWSSVRNSIWLFDEPRFDPRWLCRQ